MLETLKDYDMQEDMLDYLFDYLKKNYDVEKIINHFIDAYSDEYLLDLDDDVFALPIIAYLEFNSREVNRPEICLFLAMYFDDLLCTLSNDFLDMNYDYNRDYEEVFGELPDDIADKIDELVDVIRERVEDRLREIAKSIYDEILNLINNNPEYYKIVDYEECDSYLCDLLGLDKIPLVRVEENRKNYLLDLDD